MKPRWKPSYRRLVDEFITLHFGSVEGITRLFPYMKPEFKWKDKNVLPMDARTVLKNANEYHGLERHAHQYHVTAQYDYAYYHWLIAAAWRRENMGANNFKDERHKKAVEFVLRNVEYNKALHDWQQSHPQNRRRVPTPEEFGLDRKKIDKMDRIAEAEIDSYYASVILPKDS
jgi:hypothetical protein